MTKQNKLTFIVITLSLFTFEANAHSQEEHKKSTNEKPNCAAMSEMNGGEKMDLNDPVVAAMMKQCSQQSESTSHSDHQDKTQSNHGGHAH